MDRQQFVAALRSALMQLDDLHSLRTNPLLTLITVQEQPATPAFLQRLLMDAIDDLQGDTEAPFALTYEILYYRYVEQMGQADVAFQIGVSVRQLRRYQNNALEYLADRIWQRYRFDLGVENGVTSGPASAAGMDDGLNHLGHDANEDANEDASLAQRSVGGLSDDTVLDDEIAWMRKSFHLQVSRLDTELTKAIDELAALTQHFAVKIELDIAHAELTTAIPPTLLRQTLITLLTDVIARSSGQSFLIRVTSAETSQKIETELKQRSAEPIALDAEFEASLHMASQLLQPFDSDVAVDSTTPLSIRLTMPVAAGVSILVVDDNDDVRYLYRRYAAHSRFRIIDTGNGSEVLPLMRRFKPAAIVMDIMMPDMDGWELLAQLRGHPLTAKTPVLVCTILPQKPLAEHLGATAFIQKPVSQQAFLSALDQLLTSPSQMPSL